MNAPVNLANLREITGGDPEIEKELFQVFLDSAESCLSELAACCIPEAAEKWRTQAHALKGISYNLGAEQLGDLCKKAQTEANAPDNEKQAILNAITAAFSDVRNFLHAPPPL